MSNATPTAERREEILGEVAEWLHSAARKTHRLLMESDDTDEVVRLGGSLTKIARGVRQCVMVHDRLETGRLKAETAAAEALAEAEGEARDQAVGRLKYRVSRAVARRIADRWPDCDDPDDNEAFNTRLEDLNERLDGLSESEGFLTQDADALIARLCEEFGVPAPEPPAPLIPGPLTPAKAGEAEIQAVSATTQAPHGSPPSRGRAEDGFGDAPDSS